MLDIKGLTDKIVSQNWILTEVVMFSSRLSQMGPSLLMPTFLRLLSRINFHAKVSIIVRIFSNTVLRNTCPRWDGYSYCCPCNCCINGKLICHIRTNDLMLDVKISCTNLMPACPTWYRTRLIVSHGCPFSTSEVDHIIGILEPVFQEFCLRYLDFPLLPSRNHINHE